MLEDVKMLKPANDLVNSNVITPHKFTEEIDNFTTETENGSNLVQTLNKLKKVKLGGTRLDGNLAQ